MATTLLTYDALGFDPDVLPIIAGDVPGYFPLVNGRRVVALEDGANEYAVVTRATVMPQAYAGGTLTAYIYYIHGATSGSDVWEVYVEAVTDGDATDLDSTTSFDSVNTATVGVPATAGYLDVAAVTLTNKDSVAAGDLVRFLVRRDSDAAGDDASGIAYIQTMEIRES